MSDNIGKFALGLVSLVVLWIGVYWWWEPSEPPISFGATPVVHEGPATDGEPPVPADPPGTPEPGAGVDPRETAPTQAQEPVHVKPVVAVTPPEFVEYTVRSGDTLRTISIKYFGTASQATAIARANPLMDPSRLRAGRVIRVPKDPGNIQGRPVPRPSVIAKGPASTPVTTNIPTTAPKPTGTQRSYTVRPGDTLSAIAQDVYGTMSKADLIYEANRDKLDDRDELKVGMVLTIPAPQRGN